jgi:transcriptional regulator NrdR family protein
MPHCPICREEDNESVFSEETEVRGKSYLYEVCYCSRCGVKFTYFTPLEEPQPAEGS